jgi:hypothetical protein
VHRSDGRSGSLQADAPATAYLLHLVLDNMLQMPIPATSSRIEQLRRVTAGLKRQQDAAQPLLRDGHTHHTPLILPAAEAILQWATERPSFISPLLARSDTSALLRWAYA